MRLGPLAPDKTARDSEIVNGSTARVSKELGTKVASALICAMASNATKPLRAFESPTL